MWLFECGEHDAPRLSEQIVERADSGSVERGGARLFVERDRRGAAVVVGELHLDLGTSVMSADDGGTRDDGGHRAGGGSVNTMSLGRSPIVRRAARWRFHDSSCWSAPSTPGSSRAAIAARSSPAWGKTCCRTVMHRA